MRPANFGVLIATVAFLASSLSAQNARPPAYLNTALPPQQRAEDLVHRMTVEEKVSQLVNQSRAIPRLNVPDYDWWSEALHGVATKGITSFPGRRLWPRRLIPMQFTAWPSRLGPKGESSTSRE